MHPVPPDAGDYGMTIDGEVVNLEGARRILELDGPERTQARG